MIRSKPKKTAADYPLFALRMPQGTVLEELLMQIDKVKAQLSKGIPEGHKQITRGAVVLQAIEIGLTEMKRAPKRFVRS